MSVYSVYIGSLGAGLSLFHTLIVYVYSFWVLGFGLSFGVSFGLYILGYLSISWNEVYSKFSQY
jgi:hypothetical protein